MKAMLSAVLAVTFSINAHAVLINSGSAEIFGTYTVDFETGVVGGSGRACRNRQP